MPGTAWSCFVISSADGRFAGRAGWVGDVGRAIRFPVAGEPEEEAEAACETLAADLRLHGVDCRASHVPPRAVARGLNS